MGWTTLYIVGNSDFTEDVRSRIEQSNLKIMSGSFGAGQGTCFHDMYWVDEKLNLRKLKEKIGSKLIWKYRLRFFLSLDEFMQVQQGQQKNMLTLDEHDLAFIAEMRQMQYPRSA